MIEKEQSKSDIRLLMEETFCGEEEAELALSLSNNNIKEAISKVSALSKFISVFKIKILFPQDNIYGLMFIAVNRKMLKIMRFSIVFSQNPSIYEVGANIDWFSFEKSIFAARLLKGVLEDYTRNIEIEFKNYLENQIETSTFSSSLIEIFFKQIEVKTEIAEEVLTISEFKQIQDKKEENQTIKENSAHINGLQIEVEAFNSVKGVIASKIKENTSIYSIISDKRDIAQYIKTLLDGENKENTAVGTIKQIKEIENGYYEFYIQYAPWLMGRAKVKNTDKIKTIEKKPVWKKILDKFINFFAKKV